MFDPDPVTPEGKSVSQELNEYGQKLVVLEHKVDAMQDKMSALENETHSLRNSLVALEDKVAKKVAPTLHSIVLDEIHRIIIASQTAILAYTNAYILPPLQKLKF